MSIEDVKQSVWWEECQVFFFPLFCIYLFYIEAYLESRGGGGVAERSYVCLIVRSQEKKKTKQCKSQCK